MESSILGSALCIVITPLVEPFLWYPFLGDTSSVVCRAFGTSQVSGPGDGGWWVARLARLAHLVSITVGKSASNWQLYFS